MIQEHAQPKQPSQKVLRQRKFFLFLPILVLPFLTFLLWTIGLVGTVDAKAQAGIKTEKGLNMELPDPKLKEGNMDKLSFYQQADQDSARYKAEQKSDPYYAGHLADLSRGDTSLLRGKGSNLSYDPAPPASLHTGGGSDTRVSEKLTALNDAITKAQAAKPQAQADTQPRAGAGTAPMSTSDVDRLENMLNMMNQKGGGTDAEMQDINSVMEKILDIQHPERVQDKIRQQSLANKKEVFPVATGESRPITSLHRGVTSLPGYGEAPRDSLVPVARKHNRFYSVGDAATLAGNQNTIEAVVHETQTLVSGATVKFRLLRDIYIAGVAVPAGNLVYGVASLNGERLTVNISSIRYENNILPVALSVYDKDGLEGIYIPGAITRDVAKQSADEAIQSAGVTSLDPSLGAQAATAGIQAARTLLSKKVKLVRVVVKGGYEVLLKDQNADK